MVTYLVCFDLGAPLDEQTKQVAYWIDFLNSSLPIPSSSSHEDARWTIILIGLRSDLVKPSSPILNSDNIEAWKRKWPHLPIYDQMFIVSSIESLKSVQTLLKSVEIECNRIFSKQPKIIPHIYKKVLESIQGHPTNDPLLTKDILFQHHSCGIEEDLFDQVLQYLNSVGRIILLNNNIVFISPPLASKIAAKFVAPEEVRQQLLKEQSQSVQILKREEIGCILKTEIQNDER